VRLVVSDTGPLLHLSEAGALYLLSLVGEVHIPKMVEVELASYSTVWQKPAWLWVDSLVGTYVEEARNWQLSGLLDAGEAESVALARQRQAKWLLTDDAAARILAGSLGLEVHGSVGIVLWAAASKHLDRDGAEVALDNLTKSSMWISARIVAEARKALDQLFMEE
jgi:predicted nucleic acid-binding protein